ncbi:MAG: hypothetical protein ACREV5_20810 [Steroidobacter sp.]
MTGAEHSIAEILNRECDCAVTDLSKLRQGIEGALEPAHSIVESHPHLFSEVPVFLDPAHVTKMQGVIDAIEIVAHLPKFQDAVLREAPVIAQLDPRAAGVFMGFDFHIGRDGPKLIEVNTNAGGAFLNIAAHDAQRACCRAADEYLAAQPSTAQLETEIVSTFEREWTLARSATGLRTIAVVDENPHEQFLYPEFRLAKKLFESRGIRTHIADPSELEVTGDGLRLRGERIDLVYNRLTDFYFDAPANRALRLAYERGLAVITPHPRAHALYANKRNLALLSDAAALEKLGVSEPMIEVLTRGVPSTRDAAGCAETWWRDRKKWFFKPRSGFGSRGTYRGDKLTRRVFAEVLNGEYMAQELIPPSERWRSMATGKEAFKVDLRCYVYAGRSQLMAARLYQGQMTNFRTAGGGFAPVYVVSSDGSRQTKMEACA